MRRAFLATWPRSALASLVIGAVLLTASGIALAETADERGLRGAAYDGRLGEVERLLAEGTNPNVPDHNGRTAVHHAALKANGVILRVLLEAGGNPDAVDRDGFVPLHFAADFEFEPDSQVAIRVLLDHDAGPDRANNAGQTPLHLAARRHHSDLSILHLLDAGAGSNRPDARGDTPLHYAVDRYSQFSGAVVEALIDRGADGSRAAEDGETPLQRFARVGTNSGRIVAALVDGGADPNRKNPAGETPLHTTIRNGGNAEHPSAVEALLHLGADPCLRDATGYIPYNTAREGGTVHSMLANAGGNDIGCESSLAEAPPAPRPAFMVDPVDQEMRVTERANVRAGPGTDHPVLDTLDAGTGLRMTGKVRGTDWRRIERPRGAGVAYMHGSLLAASAGHLEVVVWERPHCVQSDGTSRAVNQRWLDHFDPEPPCAGVVWTEVTSTCDPRRTACEWPCGDAECEEEWTHTPTGSMVEFRRQVEAMSGAAGHAWADPVASEPDPVASPSEARASDTVRVETWMTPVCVDEDGAIPRLPFNLLYPALEAGTCVGVVQVQKTGTCDARTSACDWPCGTDAQCWRQWMIGPDWPYPGYAGNARAVAEAARVDPGASRAEGQALVTEAFEQFRDATPQDDDDVAAGQAAGQRVRTEAEDTSRRAAREREAPDARQESDDSYESYVSEPSDDTLFGGGEAGQRAFEEMLQGNIPSMGREQAGDYSDQVGTRAPSDEGSHGDDCMLHQSGDYAEWVGADCPPEYFRSRRGRTSGTGSIQ